MKLFALCVAAVAGLKLNNKEESENFLQMKMSTKREPWTGMTNPMENQSLENDDGGIDVHEVEDVDNEVDDNVYPGEDENREFINDEVTGFKRLHSKPVIVRNKARSHLSNHDLW